MVLPGKVRHLRFQALQLLLEELACGAFLSRRSGTLLTWCVRVEIVPTFMSVWKLFPLLCPCGNCSHFCFQSFLFLIYICPSLPSVSSFLQCPAKCLVSSAKDSCCRWGPCCSVADPTCQWDSCCSVADPTGGFPAPGFHTLPLRGLFCV